jgi:hypothetical protein
MAIGMYQYWKWAKKGINKYYNKYYLGVAVKWWKGPVRDVRTDPVKTSFFTAKHMANQVRWTLRDCKFNKNDFKYPYNNKVGRVWSTAEARAAVGSKTICRGEVSITSHFRRMRKWQDWATKKTKQLYPKDKKASYEVREYCE